MKILKYIFFDFAGTIVKMRPPTLLPDYDLLAKLEGKYKLGLITGANKSETVNILKKLKIQKFFEVVITANDSSLRKPDPKLFPELEIIAYAGDSKKDEVFARNGNIPFFRVNKKCNINGILKYLILK